MKTARTKAEEKFNASEKNFKQAMREKEKEQVARAKHVTYLRDLRLAKEAADKKAADEAAAAKLRAKKKKTPVRAQKGH